MSIIPSAHAAQAAAPQAGGLTELLMIGGMVLVFYFLLLRPQNKRQKEHRDLVAKLQSGDEIVSNSGMLGKINSVKEDFLTVTIADGVEVKMQKHAVSAVLPKGTIKSVN